MTRSAKYSKFLVSLFCLFFLFLLVVPVLAADGDAQAQKPPTLGNISNQLEKTGGEKGIGLNTGNLQNAYLANQSIGLFINFVVSLIGIVAVFFLIYAGWLWMTASGNEEQVTKAKSVAGNAVIALIIILSAYAIYAAVFYFVVL